MGLLGVLLAVGVVGAYWQWFLAAGAVYLIYRRARPAIARVQTAWERRAAEHAALAADEQNALVLAGDPRGVHGRFPPASIP